MKGEEKEELLESSKAESQSSEWVLGSESLKERTMGAASFKFFSIVSGSFLHIVTINLYSDLLIKVLSLLEKFQNFLSPKIGLYCCSRAWLSSGDRVVIT